MPKPKQETTGNRQNQRYEWERERAAAAGSVLSFEQEVAWHCRVQVISLTLTNQARGWRLVCKGIGHGGAVVAFVNGKSSAECLEEFLFQVQQGCVTWLRDKYPKVGKFRYYGS